MPNRQLFNQEFGWYKGNLHTHTTMSDGVKSPQECIKIFKKAEYDFLSITDHWQLADEISCEGMIIFRGCEYHFIYGDSRRACHIVAVCIESILKKNNSLSPQDAINDIRRQGGISIVAHPHWSYMSHQDLYDLKEYDGVEIYNSLCAVEKDNGDASSYIDVISTKGVAPLLFATEDTHRYTRELFGGFIMVNSPEFTHASLLESIKKGRFYCSQDPAIKQIEIDGESIHIKTSPVKHIIFHPDSHWTGSHIFAPEGEYITEASNKIHPLNRTIRVECIDGNGKKAWSQLIHVNRH